MRSLIPLAIIALLLVGRVHKPGSPIYSANHSYQLFELLSKAEFKNSFSFDADISMTVNDAYAAVMFTSHMEEINHNQKFNIEG